MHHADVLGYYLTMENITDTSEVRGQFIAHREGQFTVKTFGDNHCGLKPLLAIKYVVDVTCDVKLDERGFLFEQLSVDEFFQKHQQTDLSCERFAIDCARRLWQTILAENPNCNIIDMKLTLSPEPHHFALTFHHNRERDESASTSGKPRSNKRR